MLNDRQKKMLRMYRPDRFYTVKDPVPHYTPDDTFQLPVIHERWMFSAGKITILVAVENDDLIIRLIHRNLKPVFSFSVLDVLTDPDLGGPPDENRALKATLMIAVVDFTMHITAQDGETNTPSDPVPVVWERQGDTIKYIRPASPFTGEGSAREFMRKKRLHAVRGHYRKLKSGERVWVKPHMRGDESVGRVLSAHEI